MSLRQFPWRAGQGRWVGVLEGCQQHGCVWDQLLNDLHWVGCFSLMHKWAEKTALLSFSTPFLAVKLFSHSGQVVDREESCLLKVKARLVAENPIQLDMFKACMAKCDLQKK